jgi:hypothetical protein
MAGSRYLAMTSKDMKEFMCVNTVICRVHRSVELL